MEEVVWFDNLGYKHQTKVLAKHTHTFEMGTQKLKKSWVATWHPGQQKPIWLDLQDCEGFISG